jgi:hypothetical protein
MFSHTKEAAWKNCSAANYRIKEGSDSCFCPKGDDKNGGSQALNPGNMPDYYPTEFVSQKCWVTLKQINKQENNFSSACERRETVLLQDSSASLIKMTKILKSSCAFNVVHTSICFSSILLSLDSHT